MNCEFCEDTGWEATERGAVRCRHTRNVKAQTETVTPINRAAVATATRSLGAIAFFPQDQSSQTVIGDALASMCPSVESLRYVVRRATALYRSWDKCGIPGLRQIVCSKYRPADGVESGPTDQFPEGIPSETKHDPLALPPSTRKALPSGHDSTADPDFESAIVAGADVVKMPTARGELTDRFSKLLKETLTAPQDRTQRPAPEPISESRRAEIQAQIVAVLSERKQA